MAQSQHVSLGCHNNSIRDPLKIIKNWETKELNIANIKTQKSAKKLQKSSASTSDQKRVKKSIHFHLHFPITRKSLDNIFSSLTGILPFKTKKTKTPQTVTKASPKNSNELLQNQLVSLEKKLTTNDMSYSGVFNISFFGISKDKNDWDLKAFESGEKLDEAKTLWPSIWNGKKFSPSYTYYPILVKKNNKESFVLITVKQDQKKVEFYDPSNRFSIYSNATLPDGKTTLKNALTTIRVKHEKEDWLFTKKTKMVNIAGKPSSALVYDHIFEQVEKHL